MERWYEKLNEQVAMSLAIRANVDPFDLVESKVEKVENHNKWLAKRKKVTFK